MAGGKPIKIAILANARQAIDETDKIKKSLGDLGKATGASKLKNGFKNLAKGLAIGAGAVVAGVGALAVSTAKDLARVERLGAQTEAVIKATGGAAGRSKTQVDAMAGQLERLTGVEAETVTEGQNMLLTFKNIKGDQFDAATKAALDMGVAMNNGSVKGLDLQKTSIQLGKALNDPIKGISALSKVGVTFNDQQREQIKNMVEAGNVAGAQGVILKELQGEFGGAAAAAGKTTEGMIAKVENAFGNIAEKLFAFVLPLVQKLAQWVLTKAMPALDRFADWFKSDGVVQAKNFGDQFNANVLPTLKAFGSFLTGTVVPALVAFGKFLLANGKAVLVAAAVLATLVAAYKAYIAVQRIVVATAAVANALHLKQIAIWTAQKVALVAVRTAMGVATAAQWLWNAAMSANPIGLLIAAIAALVAGLVWFFTKTKAGQAIVRVVWKGIQAAIEAVTNWWKNTAWPTIQKVWNSIIGAFRTGKNKVSEFMKAALAVIKTVWKFTPLGFIISNWNKIMAWFGKIPGRVKSVFTTAINFIKNIWRYTPIGIIISNWSRIIDFFRQIPGRVRTIFGNAIGWLVGAGRSILRGLLNGVQVGWSAVSGWFSGVRSRVASSLGNAAGILYGAGRAIISGFLSGLRSAWGSVTDFVGGIASWIAANKGPLSYDRRLLRPAGKAIMDGLRKSMQGELPRLKGTLETITEAIQAVGMNANIEAEFRLRGSQLAAAVGLSRAPVQAQAQIPVKVDVDLSTTGDPLIDAIIAMLRKTIRVNGNNPQEYLKGTR